MSKTGRGGRQAAFDVNVENLWRHWRVLCEEIGERRAGSSAEARAGDYIAEQFAAAGAQTHIETFECNSLRGGQAELAFLDGDRWRPAAAQIIVGASGTPGGDWVEGELAWLEMPESLPALKKNSLAGRIAVIFGPMPTEPAEHTRMIAANPLATIHVDERLPFDWCKNDGVYPHWARKYGWPPLVTVSYCDAWKWRLGGVRRLRLRSQIEMASALSQNVVAELPGQPGEAVIVLGAHHDTQINLVGADDNASGVVALLEMARLLADRPRRRTIRLISFGTEEQLSVGAAAYVRAHRGEIGRVLAMINFDSIASPLGHYRMTAMAGPRAADWLVGQLARRGAFVQSSRGCSPFVDAFSFAAAGAAAFSFGRPNIPGGRWQHHGQADNLDNVSGEVVARLIGPVTAAVDALARARQAPFDRRRDKELNERIATWARQLYGMKF